MTYQDLKEAVDHALRNIEGVHEKNAFQEVIFSRYEREEDLKNLKEAKVFALRKLEDLRSKIIPTLSSRLEKEKVGHFVAFATIFNNKNISSLKNLEDIKHYLISRA